MLCTNVLYGRLLELRYKKLNYTQENSFSQKGKVPKTKSIRSVALFDANDGTILIKVRALAVSLAYAIIERTIHPSMLCIQRINNLLLL